MEVNRQHNMTSNHTPRTSESLRRKFAALCRAGLPTGSASCPRDVREAKQVRRMIIQRADIADGEDASDAVSSVFDSNDSIDSNRPVSATVDSPADGDESQDAGNAAAARMPLSAPQLSIRTPRSQR